MKNITVYKGKLIHVRKKHKYVIRARLLEGKERDEIIRKIQRARHIWATRKENIK